MYKSIIGVVSMCVCVFALHVHAQGGEVERFKVVNTIQIPNISVPTVVEAPLEARDVSNMSYLVHELESDTYLPYYIHETYTLWPVPVQALLNDQSRTYSALTDKKLDTSEEFLFSEIVKNEVELYLRSETPVTSSALRIDLSDFVALPQTVRISAFDPYTGIEKIVVATTIVDGNTIHFPATQSSLWKVVFTYSQPLRMTELTLIQDDVIKSMTAGIRFLVQPGMTYKIYAESDRGRVSPTVESGNLTSSEGVRVLPVTPFLTNPLYIPSDVDGDRIIDVRDNCVQVANTDQADADRNGRGDQCDDYDRDGIYEASDNCPAIPNVGQRDIDSDGIGDACDDEESRLTEKYVWVPWLGMGIAVCVLVTLFILVGIHPPKRDDSIVK